MTLPLLLRDTAVPGNSYKSGSSKTGVNSVVFVLRIGISVPESSAVEPLASLPPPLVTGSAEEPDAELGPFETVDLGGEISSGSQGAAVLVVVGRGVELKTGPLITDSLRSFLGAATANPSPIHFRRWRRTISTTAMMTRTANTTLPTTIPAMAPVLRPVPPEEGESPSELRLESFDVIVTMFSFVPSCQTQADTLKTFRS